MDPVLIGTLLVSMMLILLLSGISIAIALAATGLVGIITMRPWGAAEYLIANFPYTFTAHFSFTVLPLFLFMGYMALDRKSTRLNSSHVKISYAVFCLK